MRQHSKPPLLVALALIVLLPSPGSAGQSLEVGRPADGAVVSRAATPVLDVAGVARFGPSRPGTRAFYLRRDACGTPADNRRLSVYPGYADGGGDACGTASGGAVNEIRARTGSDVAEHYPATDSLPVVLDASRRLSGQLLLEGATHESTDAGVATLDITVMAGKTVLAAASQDQIVRPGELDAFRFSIPLDPSLNGMRVEQLTFSWAVRGVIAAYGYLTTNGGVSFVNIPVLDPGRVQVEMDPSEYSFTGVEAVIAADGSWTAQLATPTKEGRHRLVVRAVQGSSSVKIERAISVEP